jgi:uncharacterized protein (DUF2336 family)
VQTYTLINAMTTSTSLSQEDVASLLADRSASTQMELAGKLTAHYGTKSKGGLSDKESVIADDIFRLLLSRAELQVRAILSRNLSRNDKLPADIARQMAADVNEVASPILEHSAVLSDDDLLGIIGTGGDPQKLSAIARRTSVSETVAEALVETRIDQVVSTLVQNEGASISRPTFEKIVERHSDSREVVEAMFQRSAMPLDIVERVIERLSQTMRESLEQAHGMPVERMAEMRKALDQSLELTSLKMLGFTSSDEEMMRLLNHLDGSTKMSPFLALSMGNLQLFEVSLSRLLRVPLKNVHELLKDPHGLKIAYERAELPASFFEAAALAIRAIMDLERESRQITGYKRVPHTYEVMERMEDLATAAGRPVEGLDYLLAMMKHCLRRNISPSN